MADDTPTMTVDGFTRKLWSEADRLALVAEFERWGGTQVDFCEAKGMSTKTFRSWRQRYAPAAAATAGKPAARATAGRPAAKATAGKPASFVEIAAEAGPGWDVELSLGDGVTLRVRRS